MNADRTVSPMNPIATMPQALAYAKGLREWIDLPEVQEALGLERYGIGVEEDEETEIETYVLRVR